MTWYLWPSLVLLALLPMQLQANRSHSAQLFNRDVAALAIELGLDDSDQIKSVYPESGTPMAIGTRAIELGHSVFGNAPLLGLDKVWRQYPEPSEAYALSPPATVVCKVVLSQWVDLPHQPDVQRFKGWVVFDAHAAMWEHKGFALKLINVDGGIQGLGISNAGDLLEQRIGPRKSARKLEVAGYIRRGGMRQALRAVIGPHQCSQGLQLEQEGP